MTDARPTVSVVVPTRNRRVLLTMALRSVLAQRSIDLEVIVVDEASTDDTADAIARLADPRVRAVRHERPLGVSSARNRGAAESRGEWLAFIDDDDLWAPDKLVSQLDAAASFGCDWVYTGSVNIADDSRIISGRPPLPADSVMPALRRYNAIPGGGSNVIVRRSAWQHAGPFDTRLRNTEDWEMWIRLARDGPPACVARPLLAYRVHTSNSSLDVAEIIRGARLIESMHRTQVDWGLLHRWMAESCLRRRQRRAAVAQFIRAAMLGELSGVAGDVAAIVHRRLAPRVSVSGGDIPTSTDQWLAEASRWLSQFASDNRQPAA